MTVDKPPLALWVQALSVRVFGFHSLSILVPQALMGVATRGAGLRPHAPAVRPRRRASWPGSCSALTPITVAISRHNNPDALLVLCSRRRAVVRSCARCEDGRTRWLVLVRRVRRARLRDEDGRRAAGRARRSPRPGCGSRRAAGSPPLRQLLAGGAAMVVVGGAWPLLVALTPAVDRPWISGTSDNSIWSLILGYNGLGRLDGQAGGPPAGGGPGGGGSAAARLRRRHRPAAAAERRRSAGRPAGCSASRSSAASRSSSPRACAAATRAPAG